MKTELNAFFPVALAVAVICCFVSGCASPSSQRAKPLAGAIEPGADLRSYRVATVLPFAMLDTKRGDASVGAKLAQDIRDRLRYDYGDLFTEVRQTQPSGSADEMLVTGSITKYAPGSKTARFMLAGLGAASLEGEMVVKDANTQKVLLKAPFNKLWAWGGGAGISKGIEEMMAEVAAAAASTIAHARGWQPTK